MYRGGEICRLWSLVYARGWIWSLVYQGGREFIRYFAQGRRDYVVLFIREEGNGVLCAREYCINCLFFCKWKE
jgi:hypothetical protein